MKLRRFGLFTASAIAIAVTFAVLDAAVINVADPWNRPTSAFGFAFARLLVPWLLLAVFGGFAVLLANSFRIRPPHRVRNLLLHVVCALLFPVVHLTSVALYHRIVLNPALDVVQSMRDMLTAYVAQDILAYVVVIALAHAVQYWTEARAAERSALEMQGVLAEAQLAVLRAQLHPHFLFNTLNTAVMLARDGEKEKTVEVLTNLSDLLRHVLDGDANEIALDDELELIRKYVSIEEERFQDRLKIRIAIEPEVRRALVPGFLLQPLVENAIRHGVSPQPEGGTVSVSARREESNLIVEISDDGRGTSDAHGHGIGLRNTIERLARIYGSKARCTLDPGASGATVRVTLPFRVASAGVQ